MSDPLRHIESYVGKSAAPLVLEVLEETGSSYQDESAIQEAFALLQELGEV